VRATLPADVQPVMVALTGWGREDDLKRTREAGFDHHLVKPVAPEKLRKILQSQTGRKVPKHGAATR
jgi:CheY-like chemotaxis protein